MARNRALTLRFGALVLLAGGLATVGPDRLERAPRLCLHHLVTGRDCGGCGITRALAALARGDLARAERLHPFVLPVAALGAGLVLGVGRRRRAKEGACDLRQGPASR